MSMQSDVKRNLILDRANAQNLMLSIDGKDKILPVRMPNKGEQVIIDYVNFVCDITDFCQVSQLEQDYLAKDDYADCHALADRVIHDIGQQLAYLFGEDIDDTFTNLTYTGKGLHFYKFACNIGNSENPLGKVCFGGQNGTVLIMLTGQGCAMAVKNWEHRLYNFLKSATKGYITRIDLAHDDFKGAYSSPEDADQKETDGFFYISGTKPKVQHLGDWKYNLGDGRTLQVGNRANGKVFRGYEKGKQLGDKDSKWFRAEVELSNKNLTAIPLDILISPTQYFCGFYPYTAQLIDDAIAHQRKNSKKDHGNDTHKSIRIPVIVKSAKITLDKSIAIWKKQIGRYIKAYRKIFDSDKEILDLLQTDKITHYMPKRLSFFDITKSNAFASSVGHMITDAGVHKHETNHHFAWG